MQRSAMKKLVEWKDSPRRKPLLLLGARQVGKTWLMKEFGKNCFKSTAYIRFDKNREMRMAFERDYDIARILLAIQVHSGAPVVAGETLIVLDEIQACPAALTSLKYFCEDAREYHVVAAGSLLGVGDQQGTGFPVGKVDRMYLHPMTFLEFLKAVGSEPTLELIRKRDWRMLKDFEEKIADLLRYYYFVGGMPEAVETFVDTKDFNRVRAVQKALLADFRDDFGKHASRELKPKIEKIWDSIPAQLARENKRFVYGDVQKGAGVRELEPAMRWLLDAGLITHVWRVSKPSVPLDSYKDEAFKVFFVDVGLLAAKAGLAARIIIDGNRIFQEFKGALTEQYVQQQILAETQLPAFYWTAGKNRAEVDFLIESDSGIIPIEVKAERNLQAKSLKAFCEKFRPDIAVRTSMYHYYRQTIPYPPSENGKLPGEYQLIDIPLCAISRICEEAASPGAPIDG